MFIPKKDRKAIYSYLFQEGVICAKKNYMITKKLESSSDAPAEAGAAPAPVVKNLFVIKAMTSLKSRGFVRETFSWQWYYWYLTPEGIEYLREYLHLPPDVVPDTHKKPVSSKPPQAGRPGGDRMGGGDRRGGGGFGRDRGFGGGDRGSSGSTWGRNTGTAGGDKPAFGRGGRMRDDGYRRTDAPPRA